MDKKMVAGIVVLVALILGALLVFSGKDAIASSGSQSAQNVISDNGSSTEEIPIPPCCGENSTSPENPSAITRAALSIHNTRENCWIAYKGKVYDITEFLPQHPGSAAAIAPYCGTAEEFETAFTNKHGTTKVSTLMRVGVLMGDFDYQGDLE